MMRQGSGLYIDRRSAFASAGKPIRAKPSASANLLSLLTYFTFTFSVIVGLLKSLECVPFHAEYLCF